MQLDAPPRPEAGNGGSSGGRQTQSGDNCIIVGVTTGTSELKFLDQQLEPEGTGSIESSRPMMATPRHL